MDELIRSKMHEALDAIPPPPGLLAGRSIPADRASVRSAPRPRLDWAFGVIAALLVVAIVAALMLSRALHGNIPSNTGHAVPPRPLSGMVSPTIGWVIGPGGRVFRTSDGGDLWKDVTPPGYSSNGVFPYFLDPDHGWVTQDSGATSTIVLRTGDGGASWQRSAPITVPGIHGRGPISLFFFDPANGWFLGSSIAPGPAQSFEFEFLYRTTDGGSHWQRVADTKGHSPSCPWTTVAFSSLTTGWITTFCQPSGGKPELLVSRDSGVTWRSQALPATFGDGALLFPPVFFDAAHGVVASVDSSSVATFLATADGGHIWARMNIPGQVHLAASFVDAQHGWLIAGSSDLLSADPTVLSNTSLPLYKSDDGGMTWTPVKTNLTVMTPQGRIQDIYFVNQRVGFAVAAHSATTTRPSTTLFATSDGGSSWTLVGDTPQ